jgi:hypothetical protein
MTTSSALHRRRLRSWTWQHKHELDGSIAREELLRRPTRGQSSLTFRKLDVPETDAAAPRRRPRCRSADDLSSNKSKAVEGETRALVLPSPLGLLRGGIRNVQLSPRHRAPSPVRSDHHGYDNGADSHHDPSSSDTETDPSLSSLGERRNAADQHHGGSGSDRKSRWWVRVIGSGSSRQTPSASPSSPRPPLVAALSVPKSIKSSRSPRPSSSFRFSPPRLLDEDRCLSPTQPRYLHVEDSAALSLSSSVLRRASQKAMHMVHQLGWWGIFLAALTLLEGPVVATTLLFALPLIAATLSVFRSGTARQGPRASVQSP